MARLTPCPRCGCHLRADSPGCPHCGQPAPSPSAHRAAVTLLALTLAGCNGDKDDTDPPDQALYGDVAMDIDGDGYDESVDCDETNIDIHPDATETPGDGVDSNCNGEDDT